MENIIRQELKVFFGKPNRIAEHLQEANRNLSEKSALLDAHRLLSELPKLEAEVDFLKVNKLSADDVLHEANSMHERWPSLPPDDKRKIVEALIEKIVIGNGEIG